MEQRKRAREEGMIDGTREEGMNGGYRKCVIEMEAVYW